MPTINVPYDPEAEKRSLMSQQVPRCNGHQDGHQCVHYWFRRANIKVANPGDFKKGERFRSCLRVHPTQNLDHNDLATECSHYEPNVLRPFDPQQEAYDPLTDEEISALEVLQAAHSVALQGPFSPGPALAAYKKLAAESPNDPQVIAVRAKAADAGSDLEARKREGEEARKRNAAEAAERDAARLAAAMKWDAERPMREAAEKAAQEAARKAAEDAAAQKVIDDAAKKAADEALGADLLASKPTEPK